MRRFGKFLALLGLGLGGLLSLAMLTPLHFVGLSWLVAVGLAKLTFVSALALVAGGAVLQRLARVREGAAELPQTGAETPRLPLSGRVDGPDPRDPVD